MHREGQKYMHMKFEYIFKIKMKSHFGILWMDIMMDFPTPMKFIVVLLAFMFGTLYTKNLKWKIQEHNELQKC